MRALLAVLMGFICAQASAVSAQMQTATNSYDVFRNGKKIGSHNIVFEKTDEQLTVQTHTKMKVKLLFVTAFSYDYVSTEIWRDDQILSVESDTKNSNDRIVTRALLAEGQYEVSRQDRKTSKASVISAPFVPTNHWNMIALEQEALFDTITAYKFPITVAQSQAPNQKHFSGTRYDVSGDYNYATYYDAQGHWQGMAFDRKGFIEFRCVDCQNTLWPDDVSAPEKDIKAQLSSYP